MVLAGMEKWDEGKKEGIRESLTPRASHLRNLSPLFDLGLSLRVSYKGDLHTSCGQISNHFIIFLEDKIHPFMERRGNGEGHLGKPRDKKGKRFLDYYKR